MYEFIPRLLILFVHMSVCLYASTIVWIVAV